jgi:N-acetylglucosamine kinase-like BadF-type ATPase
MFLGVDGGGTKTAFALIDDTGRILATHEGGSAYYLETGIEHTAAMLGEGVNAVLTAAGINANEIEFAFFGVPAYGEDSSIQPALDLLPAHALPNSRYQCGNDMVCSWAGALACDDGISVVAGTGSIAYGEFAGSKVRAGGWGEVFGDEGSAYWIAREGLALFSRMSDGRTVIGPLHALVRERFSLKNDLDLCAAINGPQGAARSWVAQLARLVTEAARAGDNQAEAILKRAADELAELAASVHRLLAVPKITPFLVSYSGGLFTAKTTLILNFFQQALAKRSPDCRLVEPQFLPVIGAALYAAHQCGRPLTQSALTNLKQSVDQAYI